MSEPPPAGIDVTTPNVARMYDFYLGGKDNYAADREATEHTVTCEPNGTPGSVWGTDVYTDDSSICTAAVHAGLITVEEGGEVTFELVDGQAAYEGSEANGITSNDFGVYGGSFRFVD